MSKVLCVCKHERLSFMNVRRAVGETTARPRPPPRRSWPDATADAPASGSDLKGQGAGARLWSEISSRPTFDYLRACPRASVGGETDEATRLAFDSRGHPHVSCIGSSSLATTQPSA